MIIVISPVLHPEKKLSWFVEHLPSQVSNVQEMFLKYVGFNFIPYPMASPKTNTNAA